MLLVASFARLMRTLWELVAERRETQMVHDPNRNQIEEFLDGVFSWVVLAALVKIALVIFGLVWYAISVLLQEQFRIEPGWSYLIVFVPLGSYAGYVAHCIDRWWNCG